MFSSHILLLRRSQQPNILRSQLCTASTVTNNLRGFTMKKSYLAGALAVVMLAAVLAAGCTTSTTSSPTPPPSASTTTTTSAAEGQAIVQYLATTMQQLNFTVATPFSLQPNPQAGIVVYNGTVSDKNGTYAVSVQACNNASTAQAHFYSLRNMFMRQGYTAVQQNATAWSEFNTSARPVSYTHLRAHETGRNLVCRLLLEKKK